MIECYYIIVDSLIEGRQIEDYQSKPQDPQVRYSGYLLIVYKSRKETITESKSETPCTRGSHDVRTNPYH